MALGAAPGFRVTKQLEQQYAQLYADAVLSDLSENGPDLHLLATSLTTGSIVDFGTNGAWFGSGGIDGKRYPLSAFPLARAVAASSAFPPLFRPVRIRRQDIQALEAEFPHSAYLTDGGVFDNLGTHRMRQLNLGREHGLLVVSDASTEFDWRVGRHTWGPIGRNVRSADILMGRVAELEAGAFRGRKTQPILIRISNSVKNDEIPFDAEYRVQDIDLQRACRFIRTDLDEFSKAEIWALMRHGYETTLAAIGPQVTSPPAREILTDPCPGNWPYALEYVAVSRHLVRLQEAFEQFDESWARISEASRELLGTPYTEADRQAAKRAEQERADESRARAELLRDIREGGTRRLRLWKVSDPYSWLLVLFVILFVAVVLIGIGLVAGGSH